MAVWVPSNYGTVRWWLNIAAETEAHGALFSPNVSDASGNGRTFSEEAGVEIIADNRWGYNAQGGAIKGADFRSGGDRLQRNEAGLVASHLHGMACHQVRHRNASSGAVHLRYVR